MQNIADNLLSAPQMEILRLRLVIVIARVWCSGVHGNKCQVHTVSTLYPLQHTDDRVTRAGDTREGK